MAVIEQDARMVRNGFTTGQAPSVLVCCLSKYDPDVA
jgi:hypothetical protein